MPKHIYLCKANDDFVSHCICANTDALISSPNQLDCPWCGCGWLFICSRCRKAFTFAQAVEVGESWEETGYRTAKTLYQRQPEPGEVEKWVECMKILLKGVRPGEMCVYFDGHIISTTAEGVTIEGWHSRHRLDFVPQVAALNDPSIRTKVLDSEEYWQSNRVDNQ